MTDPSEKDYTGLPESLRDGAQRYIEHHIPPGAFLEAVICNELGQALCQADSANRARLAEIVFWFINEAPAACWGSPERLRAWLAKPKVVA